MFVILLEYIKPISEVEKYLIAHRAFLDDCYAKQYFIASGPKIPRTGGIILAKVQDKVFLEQLIENDSFKIYGIALYEIIEFTPSKGQPDILQKLL
ncbi:MAG: cyclohydrolase [Gammaproteobacteria bacterium]|nr:cyclohydrolase [Gammaproteobacteria bacterium]